MESIAAAPGEEATTNDAELNAVAMLAAVRSCQSTLICCACTARPCKHVHVTMRWCACHLCMLQLLILVAALIGGRVVQRSGVKWIGEASVGLIIGLVVGLVLHAAHIGPAVGGRMSFKASRWCWCGVWDCMA